MVAIDSFLINLKEQLTSEGKLPAALYEEYVLSSGQLNLSYIESLLNERTTKAKFRSAVNSVFGTLIFEKETADNEVSKELFLEHYVPCTYPNANSWIGYFARTMDLVLTKEKLHDYILER